VRMKRTNVILDEKLLEAARRATGERTYSATITKALERVVRQSNFRAALQEFERESANGGVFDPDYLAEKSANSYLTPQRQRVSADEKRAPSRKKKVVRRGTR